MIETAHILVLEDDASLRELLVSVLQDEGFDVEAAAGGEEAVEIASRKLLDLVILDIRMEGLDGLEALALMRSNLKEAASLVITGYASEEDSIRALRLGAADYLHKPFELNIFLDKVSELLQLTKKRRRISYVNEKLQTLFSYALTTLISSLSGRKLQEQAAASAASAARTARSLADLMGLEPPAIQQAEFEAILRALYKLKAISCLPGEPAALRQSFAQSAGDEYQQISQAAETVLQILFSSEKKTLQSGLEGWIESLCGGETAEVLFSERSFKDSKGRRYLPCLAEEQNGEGSGDSAALSIALTMWHTGRKEEACQIFRRLSSSENILCKSQAFLYLGLFDLQKQQTDLAKSFFDSAMRQAVRLGPLALGKSALQIGISIAGANDELSQKYLRAAYSILDKLQAAPWNACAFFALLNANQADPSACCLNLQLIIENGDNRAEACFPILLRKLAELLIYWKEAPPTASDSGYGLFSELLTKFLKQNIAACVKLISQNRLDSKTCAAICRFIETNQQYFPYHKLQQLPITVACPPPPGYSLACSEQQKIYIVTMGQVLVRLGTAPPDSKIWLTSKIKQLFVRLACAGGPVSISQIIEEFWPNAVNNGQASLWKALSSIRRILKPHCRFDDPILRTDDCLTVSPRLILSSDAEELEQNWKYYRQNHRLQHLKRILELSEGPFMPGLDSEWAMGKRQRFNYLCNEAALKLFAHYQQQNDWSSILELSHICLRQDPLNESGCEMLMRAHMALGQPSQALSCYGHFKTGLRLALDIEPGSALNALFKKAKAMNEKL